METTNPIISESKPADSTVIKPKILNKSKSEIFSLRTQQQSPKQKLDAEVKCLRRRNVLNRSFPKLLELNNIEMKVSDKRDTNDSSYNEPIVKNRQYLSSKFFLPSNKDGNGSSDEEIEDYSSFAKMNEFIPGDNEYDLNEVDLSDSDQTESCILNDANSNHLLEFADEPEVELAALNDENNNEKTQQYKSVRELFFKLYNKY